MAARVMLSGRWSSVADAMAFLNHAPGQHDQKSHGGSGGLGDEGLDEGEHSLGRDPNGVSYTGADVDEDGNPKFSAEYREKYGPLDWDIEVSAKSQIHVVSPERGSGVHVADDSAGSKGRQVVQELSQSEAHRLSDAVWEVSRGERASATSSGIRVDRVGDDLSAGVSVRWGSGRTDVFDGETGDNAAFELAQALVLA